MRTPIWTTKIEKLEDGWGKLQISVYKDEDYITSYFRNYNTNFNNFCAFRHENKWYALVSPSYGSTSVISLEKDNAGQIIATEEVPGFCPTGYFIARYQILNIHLQDKIISEIDYDIDDNDIAHNNTLDKPEIINYDLRLVLVAGCHWGDDSSWKVERLDLSTFLIDNKIRRLPLSPNGYHELAAKQNLSDAVSSIYDENNILYYHLNLQTAFKINKEGISNVCS